jgi:signal transduction histidine kinase
VEDLSLTEWASEALETTAKGDAASKHELKSLLGMPITLEGELIGAINIASRKARAFDHQSLAMVERLAVQAAIAIRNAYQFKVERHMQKRLASISQVVAMGDMASNMVHRINNWVGAIRADVNYLKRQQSHHRLDLNEAVELLDDMLANAESTLAMAENIRKPFQSLDREPIDVNECIHNVLADKADQLADLVIFKDLDDTLPPVLATQQLELVFENLINNALQAIEQEIAQNRADNEASRNTYFSQYVLRFSTRTSEDKQWVEIIIQDSGPGLSDQVNEIDIFKLGVSGRENGMGYGLWWCDTFLKRWGGDIQLLKDLKKGCKFLIRLPVLKT